MYFNYYLLLVLKNKGVKVCVKFYNVDCMRVFLFDFVYFIYVFFKDKILYVKNFN